MVFSALRDRHDRHVLPSSGLPYPTVPLPHGRGLHVMYGVSGVGLEGGALQTRNQTTVYDINLSANLGQTRYERAGLVGRALARW